MSERILPGHRLGLKPTPRKLMMQIPKLTHYVALPKPPPGPIDVSQGITTWPMFLNNSLGDCTCAAAGHMVEIFGKEAGTEPKILEDADILALYETQGYKPGDPSTDRGADLGSVCAAWKSGAWKADKILAYAQIDTSNTNLLKTAMWLFSGLYLGVLLPLTAQGQSTWDVVAVDPSQSDPGTWGGHAINAIKYDDDGLWIVTWGQVKLMTWRFWQKYALEAFVVVSADFDIDGDKPVSAGFNEQQLLADMAQMEQL